MVASAGGLGEGAGRDATFALTVLNEVYSARPEVLGDGAWQGQGVDMCFFLKPFCKTGCLFRVFMFNEGIQGRGSGGAWSMANRGSCAIGRRPLTFPGALVVLPFLCFCALFASSDF